MLVLTRKSEQSIVIDGDIEVVILAVEGNKVRVGIKAPDDVVIQRSEIVLDASASGPGSTTA